MSPKLLRQFADRLEKAEDLNTEISALMRDTVRKHQRMIFNGNNYTQEWVDEADRRGLPNIGNTVDAIAVLKSEKNLALLEKHAVLSRIEMESRSEILYENYIKTIHIEALTMIEMAKRQILPSAITYKGHLAGIISSVEAIGSDTSVERGLCEAYISQQLVSFRKTWPCSRRHWKRPLPCTAIRPPTLLPIAIWFSPRWACSGRTVTNSRSLLMPGSGRSRPTAICCSLSDSSAD